MAKSPRIQMPLLSAGQAQKEVAHNEALILVDSLLQACTAGAPSNSPPSSPELGLCYICGTAPTGAWSGRAQAVACFTMGGWRIVDAFDGMRITDRASGRIWCFVSGEWSLGVIKGSEVQVDGVKVLGGQQPAISPASGGSVVDAQARTVLALILEALRGHGLIAAAG